MSKELDFKDVRDIVADALKDELRDVVEGAAEDIRHFAFDVALALVTARGRAGTERDVEYLRAQLRALAAINRVRVVDAQWEIFEKVTNVAQSVALGLLGKLGGLI